MFCDTHFHFECGDSVDMILKDAREAGVSLFILAGTNETDNLLNLEYAQKYADVFLCCGFHPEEASSITESSIIELKKWIGEHRDKIVGIGEIGLDYHYGKENREQQLWLFEQQLGLAYEFHLPVVVHSRDAYLDTYQLLKKYKDKVFGIIHCFSGSYEAAESYLDLGYFLGIGGVVTFQNSHLKDVVKKLPLERIVLETDSPYLSPFRGKRNSPKNIPIIAQCLANIYSISCSEVGEITTETTQKIFFKEN